MSWIKKAANIVMPGSGAVFDSIMSIGGGLLQNAASANAADKAAKRQITWERERAQNAHQWEVKDLIAAGLNPILSAGGSGATTGGISAPVPDTSGIGMAINSALDARRLQNETAQTAAMLDKNKADINETNARTSLLDQQTISELAKRRLISKQEATEVSKQTLNYASAQKYDTELKIQKEKLGLELGSMAAQIDYLKEQKKYKEADALMKQYENKMKQFSYWFDKGERAAKILIGGINSAGNLAGNLIKL